MQSVGHMFYITAVQQYMTGDYNGDVCVYSSVRTKSLNTIQVNVCMGYGSSCLANNNQY
jgi:hypothetical protein